MKEPKFIQKEDSSPFHKDFKELKKQGVESLQNLSGELWTDYNTHDPGVTILENVVFAITDLCYKMGFEVSDFLKNEEGELDTDHLALYPPEKILTTNPVTVDDFRKVLFDRVTEIENIWLEEVVAERGEVQGLYDMYVFLDPTPWNRGEEHSQQLKDKVERQIRELWLGIRSFGEDLNRIVFLKPQFIYLDGELIFSNTDSLEETLAEIVFKMDQYFSPGIRRHTLEDLLEQNIPVEEIFKGPRLLTGFIRELPARPTEVSRARILALLSGVENIDRVEELRLLAKDQSESTRTDRIKVKEGHIPRFRFEKKESRENIKTADQKMVRNSGVEWVMTLKLRKKNSSKYLDMSYDKMVTSLRTLQALQNRSYSIDEAAASVLDLPDGQYRQFDQYFSIRNLFPYIYGVNQYGISRHEKDLRKAQVKQLKGYLLLFEQLMANNGTQIQNLKNIFSVSEDHGEHFFYQKHFKDSEINDIDDLYQIRHESPDTNFPVDSVSVLEVAFHGFKNDRESIVSWPGGEVEEFRVEFLNNPLEFGKYFDKGVALLKLSGNPHHFLDQFLRAMAVDPKVVDQAFEGLKDKWQPSKSSGKSGLEQLFEGGGQGDLAEPEQWDQLMDEFMGRMSERLPHLPFKSLALDYMIALYGEQFNQKTLKRIGGTHQRSSEKEVVRNKIRMLKMIPYFSANVSKAPAYPARTDPEEMSGFELKVQVLLGLIENDLDGSADRSLFNAFLKFGSFVSTKELRKPPFYEIEQRNRLKTERIQQLIEKRLVPSLSEFDHPSDHDILDSDVKKSIRYFRHKYISEPFLKNGSDPEQYVIYPVIRKRSNTDADHDVSKHYSHVWSQENQEDHQFHLLLKVRYLDQVEWHDLGALPTLKLAVNMGWYLVDICSDLNQATERFTVIDHIKLRPYPGESDVDFRKYFKDRQQLNVSKAFGFYNFTASVILPAWNKRFSDRAFQQLAEESILINLPAHILGQVYWLDAERYQQYEEKYRAWTSDLVAFESIQLEILETRDTEKSELLKLHEKAQGDLAKSRKEFVHFLLKLRQDRFHADG